MRKSTTVAILAVFAGYAVASYGLVLLRGWDIPWRNWIDPLHPWVWSGTPPPIPQGQVFPGQASSAAGQAAAGGNTAIGGSPEGAGVAGGVQASAQSGNVIAQLLQILGL